MFLHADSTDSDQTGRILSFQTGTVVAVLVFYSPLTLFRLFRAQSVNLSSIHTVSVQAS